MCDGLLVCFFLFFLSFDLDWEWRIVKGRCIFIYLDCIDSCMFFSYFGCWRFNQYICAYFSIVSSQQYSKMVLEAVTVL